jgi:hypothetical protein
MLGVTSKKLYLGITVGRFREHQSDATLLGFVRALAQITATFNGCLRDAELEALKERLDRIEGKEKERVRIYE